LRKFYFTGKNLIYYFPVKSKSKSNYFAPRDSRSLLEQSKQVFAKISCFVYAL